MMIKLDDDIIKTVIQAHEDTLDYHKERYRNAVESIQQLCKHTELESMIVGNRCVACGRLTPYDDKRALDGYIKKGVCNDSVE